MVRAAPNQPSRPSIADVAAAAGVSKGAVSKVIRNAYGVSPAMRQRVESAIDALGYRPRLAARVMRGASFTLGFEIPMLANDFFTQVMQGSTAQLAGSGYQLIIAPGMGEMRGEAVLDSLVDRQVDGIIAISPDVTPSSMERLGEQVPIVLLGRHDRSSSYDTLTNDDGRGAGLAMKHLLDHGHQRILHLTVRSNPEIPDGLLPHAIRRSGYQAAMNSAGLPIDIVFTGASEPDAYSSCVQALSRSERPTAIFAANDTLAIGALRARTELGLSPYDLSIVGYDNIDLASNPLLSLTTVDQFGYLSGEKAVQLLLERIRGGRTTAEHYLISPELRIRQSSQPAGKGVNERLSGSRQSVSRASTR